MAATSAMGRPIIPAKIISETVNGNCGIYKFVIKSGSIVYRYDVTIRKYQTETELSRGAAKEFSRAGADAAQKNLYNRLCGDLLQSLFQNTECFGVVDLHYVYDFRKNLFTNLAIDFNSLMHQHNLVEAASMSKFARKYLNEISVEILIVPSKAPILKLDDSLSAMRSLITYKSDNSLKSFLEILTNQPFINDETHHAIGRGLIFEKKSTQSPQPGIVTRIGMAKGVRIIENFGNPVPGLVLDVKNCAFFAEANLKDCILAASTQEQANPQFWNNLNDLFRGVRGYLTYAPNRSIVILKFTTLPIKLLTFMGQDGNVIEVPDYFQKKKKQKNLRLDWPAVRADGSRNCVFPIECVYILPNQKLPIAKMSENTIRRLAELNAVVPSIRHEKLNKQFNSLASGSSAKFLKKFGVELNQASNDIQISIRTPPGIDYFGKNDARVTIAENGRFSINHFYKTAPLLNWVMAAPRNLNTTDDSLFNKIRADLIRTAKFLNISDISEPIICSCNADELMEKIGELAEKEFKFFLYLDHRHTPSHGVLKLAEAKHKSIITQHITFETIAKIGKSTLENILRKLNMKNYGLNYIPRIEASVPGNANFELNNGKILIISYDVAHPTTPATPYEKFQLRQTKDGREHNSFDPSVVGFCANYGIEAHNFMGDYFYQGSRRESVEPEQLVNCTEWILKKFNEINPKKVMPKLIFVLRDGISESMFSTVIENEIPALREGCLLYNLNYKPLFIFIVVTKRHNKRFFLLKTDTNSRRMENLAPNSEIDKKVVLADCPEFFMLSHVPLKGTAKPPQYAIILNEIQASTDHIQSFLNMLCYSHQIVSSSISLPAPIFQAHELAKRGMNNYLQLKKYHSDEIPKNYNNIINFKKLTEMLSFKETPLCNTRVTA